VKTTTCSPRSRSSDETVKDSQAASIFRSPLKINLIPSACDATAISVEGDSDSTVTASKGNPGYPKVQQDDAGDRRTGPRKGQGSLRNLKLLNTFDREDPMVAAAIECRSKSVSRSMSMSSLKHLETLGCEDLRVSTLMDAHATGADNGHKSKIVKRKSMRQLKTLETLPGEDMLVASVMQAHKGVPIMGAAS